MGQNFSHNSGTTSPITTSPDDSLVDLLEKFYRAFDITSYLDQIGIIDDRITLICAEVDDLFDHFGDDPDIRPSLDRIRDLIDLDRN